MDLPIPGSLGWICCCCAVWNGADGCPGCSIVRVHSAGNRCLLWDKGGYEHGGSPALHGSRLSAVPQSEQSPGHLGHHAATHLLRRLRPGVAYFLSHHRGHGTDDEGSNSSSAIRSARPRFSSHQLDRLFYFVNSRRHAGHVVHCLLSHFLSLHLRRV